MKPTSRLILAGKLGGQLIKVNGSQTGCLVIQFARLAGVVEIVIVIGVVEDGKRAIGFLSKFVNLWIPETNRRLPATIDNGVGSGHLWGGVTGSAADHPNLHWFADNLFALDGNPIAGDVSCVTSLWIGVSRNVRQVAGIASPKD